MNVYEIKLKVFLLNTIMLNEIQTIIADFIDTALANDESLLKMHNENKFKGYCFSGLYPIEKDKIYKKDSIYTITLRTINRNIAEFFSTKLVNEYNKTVKGLTSEIRIIPKKHIDKIYSLTPVILKNNEGYWKNAISLGDFERRLKENIIKKYNFLFNTKLEEDFQFYTTITFKNSRPIVNEYKRIKLLGDKISLNIEDNENAQKLAYLSLGTGILEMNARGYGFCNYRWL